MPACWPRTCSRGSLSCAVGCAISDGAGEDGVPRRRAVDVLP